MGPLLGAAAGAGISALINFIAQKFSERGQKKKNATIAQRMQNMNPNTPNAQTNPNMPQTYGDWSGQQSGPVGVANYTPEQQAQQAAIGKMGTQGLQNYNFDFGPIKENALQDFYQQFMPHMLERFGGLSQNQNSSNLLNSLGQAGKGLGTQLAAMQQEYGQNQQRNYMDMAKMGQSQQWENMFRERQPGTAETLATSLLPAGIQAGGTALGAYLQGKAFGDAMKPKEQPFTAQPLNTNYNFLGK